MELARTMLGTGTLAAVALAGALAGGRPPVLAAVEPPWQPPPCQPPGAEPTGSAAGSQAPASPAAGGPVTAGRAAWYRLDPVLDDEGSLSGQRLTLGLVGGPTRHLDLPPESSASGPVGEAVLVAEDDGAEARLRLLDVEQGCETVLARERSVIRGALLAPDGTGTWEHRVNRVTRDDEGVWHRPTGGVARLVMPGLPKDGRFGPTFVTELSWVADGRLGVSSCGERACRTRLLDTATGRVVGFDGTGPLLGADGPRALALGACAGLPCPIETIDLRTGRRSVLVREAGPAAMAGGLLVFCTPDGTLAALDPANGRRAAVEVDAGMLPVPRTSAATSGAGMPPGSVLLAPDGHLERPPDGRRLDAVDLPVDQLLEVVP